MKSILRLVQLILLFCIFTVAALFFWENSVLVQVQFMQWISPKHPLATSLLLSFCFGFFAASFYFILEFIRSKNSVRQAKKHLKELQKEIDELRNNPLQNKFNEENSRSWVNDMEQSTSIQTKKIASETTNIKLKAAKEKKSS